MLKHIAESAQLASFELMQASTIEKNNALKAIKNHILSNKEIILSANSLDMNAGKTNGLTESLLDRLLLTSQRLDLICEDLETVIKLDDPVGSEFDGKQLENGLFLKKRTVPLGVIGVIYEARPNVTIDIASLTLKTGNACILRGGKETLNSNITLVKIIKQALKSVGFNENCVQLIEDPDRNLVLELLKMDKYIDMIIPRGGQKLQNICIENSTIPVITGGIGICHLFVDNNANIDKALDVIENAKVQRPSVCNALDTLLIHKKIAKDFIPKLVARLTQNDVFIKGCHQSIDVDNRIAPIDIDGYDTEWLSLTLGIKVVEDVNEAILHIRAHSTSHSDGILTQNISNADLFVMAVNSAAVYVNASTRFSDGSQFGLGAEVAVSTQKLHARGPMGLEALTTYKWIGQGDNLIRN
ncbi:glutamate-5-semialdehyde dehydrogenase [Pseudoalteromonas denitrificans]|uniref:Gamma-glutamyl phosphate reductase n=1 Tax=Pseudoalteromonas denitrificans DSM 6059 TaxID=1123010 RepID=A0A1I1FZS8_9GAMM|nr:glutamate-5-semialdehyde dehydrogenase [Pseudoalteromonas denitrificans]SFC05099.1 glutamate-5-semialdehyde dehydrogenase [Pseudoalteromonas denitrificans DSM 6059]